MSILASYFPDIPKKDLEEIENLYNHPDRAYHNIQHIRFCLAQLLSLDIDLTEEEKSQLGLAILFHDVIYLPKQEDLENIRASCKFAEKKLKEW
jgi:predicted metal-dependent HD superfamily phosphohydrolase